MTSTAFETGICTVAWTALIRLLRSQDAITGNDVSAVAAADSLGKVLCKYYCTVQLNLQQLGYKFCLSDPRLCPDAGDFMSLDITIGLYGNAALLMPHCKI